MATIEDFQEWLVRDLSRFGDETNHIEFVQDGVSTSVDGPPAKVKAIRVYTDTNRYSVRAQEHADDDNGYLGCQASSRKPRAGEDWTRGSDLADGPLSEETWHKILGDIISYEMVRIQFAPDESTAGVPEAG